MFDYQLVLDIILSTGIYWEIIIIIIIIIACSLISTSSTDYSNSTVFLGQGEGTSEQNDIEAGQKKEDESLEFHQAKS